jgi:N-methylhydantoinase B
MTARDIDPITFEVVRNGLDLLVDEMALTVMRTAHSGIVKDAMDYSTAFCDRQGRVIAQGLTILMHLGSFPDAIASVLTKYDGRIAPGDIFILNDPYSSGGIHLPDIYIIKPIFVEGGLEGFAGVIAHHTDVGGIVPGSNSTDSTEIYQEGLRIPTLKLYDAGKPNDTMFAIIQKNVRLPDLVMGDLRAQIAAAHTGERQFLSLAGKYGAAALSRYMDALLDYTEDLARNEIADLPDGTYEATGHIDADNIDAGPVVIQASLTISGEYVTVDLTGSSPQVKAGINSPLPFTKAAVYGAIRLVMDPGIPNSAGYTRLIEVRAPEASVVHPRLPAPCGARGITGFRVMDTVMAALAKAVPERTPADGDGGNTIISIGGYDEDLSPFAFVDLFAGARGGRPTGDGPEGVAHPAANISNTPVEIAEVELPVRIEEYGILRDTGGAGKYRGALAQVRRVRSLAGEATLQLRSDKRRFPPYGLQGGEPGRGSWNILNPGESETVLKTMGTATMKRDDVILHTTASGGGWGDPLERDPAMVLSDVRDDKVSTAHAREAYGVVLDNESTHIDTTATEELRRSMRSNRGDGAR